jgi:hypothetical protein
MKSLTLAMALIALCVLTLVVAPHLPFRAAVYVVWAGHICALVALPVAVIGGGRELWKEMR